MLTWLDKWCSGMRFKRLELLAGQGRRRDDFCRNDGLAAREAVLDGLSARMKLQERGEDTPLPIFSLAMFAPFFVAPREESFVRAWQVTHELAELLEEVELTPESVRRTRASVSPYWSIYIDIPSGVIQIGGDAELRAVFVQPMELGSGGVGSNGEPARDVLAYSAIVAPKGKYGWRKALWSDDRSQLLVDNVKWSSPPESEMPTFRELLECAKWSYERFQDEVERLAYLVIEHAEDHERTVTESLPHMAAENERRTPGHGNVADRFSLFRVQRIRPRREVRSGGEKRDQRAWRLGKRITVRPHWRRIRVASTGEVRQIRVREHHKGPVEGLPVHPLIRL
ncbi:hypothetical protein ABIB75_001078 [Bradyrhizobium sp. GM2.2]|uniref:hypothetical protein n=1 Tax=Bradyrhizobium sp. GM2.2 TaxID=3156358 RepID=UPI00339A5FD8